MFLRHDQLWYHRYDVRLDFKHAQRGYLRHPLIYPSNQMINLNWKLGHITSSVDVVTYQFTSDWTPLLWNWWALNALAKFEACNGRRMYNIVHKRFFSRFTGSATCLVFHLLRSEYQQCHQNDVGDDQNDVVVDTFLPGPTNNNRKEPHNKHNKLLGD